MNNLVSGTNRYIFLSWGSNPVVHLHLADPEASSSAVGPSSGVGAVESTSVVAFAAAGQAQLRVEFMLHAAHRRDDAMACRRTLLTAGLGHGVERPTE